MKKNPLEQLRHDAGMMGIFHTIGCIGDSLSSGEFEFDDNGVKGFWDYYEYSWGKCIERASGIQITNFSRGGLTAKDFYTQAETGTCTHPDVNHVFDEDNLKQGYIVALGVNDIKGEGYHTDAYDAMGDARADICIEDYEKNANTIIGWYAKIIQRLQSLQKDAKFFLVGIPKDNRPGTVEYNAQLEAICQILPNCYFIDLYTYGPEYDEAFHEIYFDGHMNAMGYQLTAWMLMTYIDAIIQENIMDFRYVQFIGTGREPYGGADRGKRC